jgi:hypothetical protein
VRLGTGPADFYRQPPEELSAHQDQRLTAAAEAPRLLVGHQDLQGAMAEVVLDARQYLAVTGSRSRDPSYLDTIETTLAEHHDLVRYRVLFGPAAPRGPARPSLRLLALRDPADRRLHGVGDPQDCRLRSGPAPDDRCLGRLPALAG